MDTYPPQEDRDELSPSAGYAAWASIYDNDGNPLIALEEPVMKGMMGHVAGLNALDVGCGTGRLSLAMAEAGASVVAVDQSPEMMARAQGKCDGMRVRFVRHALPGPLPFANGTFHLAVMGLVVEHVADLEAVMREVARVVKPGGRCLVSALHPDRTASGQRARFIDPTTGIRRPITTIHRTLEEYRAIANASGWIGMAEGSLIVPPSLLDRYPRASKYLGLKLGWVASWLRTDDSAVTLP